MIVVCDSGSTKADWKFINEKGEESDYSTMGFNPVFHKKERILTELKKDFGAQFKGKNIEKIFFYGAGCWDKELKSEVAEALMTFFPGTTVEVDHDLLGAARATCGDQAGIACILGTGSNSCLFDGINVVDNITNLGYQVGDEGSGSYLGKMLIRSYFYREMPTDLKTVFEQQYPGKQNEILDGIYEGASPNVYLASFAKFMSDQKKHFFIEKIVYQAFSEFIDRHVRKYAGHLHIPIHFIGSVAYHFSDILKIVLEERLLVCGQIIKKPIENLASYHASLENIKPAFVNE